MNLNYLKLIYIVLRTKLNNNFLKKKKYILFPAETSLDLFLNVLPIYLSVYKAGYEIEIYLSVKELHLIPIYLLLGVLKFRFLIPIRLGLSKFINYKKIFDYKKYIYPSLARHNLDTAESILEKDELISNLEVKTTNMLNHLSKTNFKNIEALFLTDDVYCRKEQS